MRARGYVNSFKANSRFEAEFTTRLVPAVAPLLAAHDWRLTQMAWQDGAAKQGLDRDLQKSVGDFVVSRVSDGKIVYAVDLKVERRSSPNLFFETFSNYAMDPDRAKLGWGMTLRTDRIWYAFDDAGAVAILALPRLRGWLDEKVQDGRGRTVPRACLYRELPQSTHQQMNTTMGRLVPFADLPEDVWKRSILLDGGTAAWAGRDEFLARIAQDRRAAA